MKHLAKLENLRELFYYLASIDIEYRKSLSLDSNLTFGIEIEFSNLTFDEIMSKYVTNMLPNYIKSNDIKNKSKYFLYKFESSVDLYNSGCEIVSSIMHDNEKDWNKLAKVCYFLKQENAKITNLCAGHIHIGAHLLTEIEHFITLIKLWLVYEPIIFYFGYGEDIKPRKLIYTYAMSINFNDLKNIDKLKDDCAFIKDFLNILTSNLKGYYRNVCLNLDNIKNVILPRTSENTSKYKDTIEFRNPNGTLKPSIWQNNINFFTKMIMAIINNKIDLEYLNYRFNNLNYNNNIDSFNNIHIADAIELADIIFNDEIDKFYFLKQYFKLFDYVKTPKKVRKIMETRKYK